MPKVAAASGSNNVTTHMLHPLNPNIDLQAYVKV